LIDVQCGRFKVETDAGGQVKEGEQLEVVPGGKE